MPKSEGDSITRKTKIHCFACNGDIMDPEVYTKEKVLDVYRNVKDKVTLSGPTYFGPILQQMIDMQKRREASGDKKQKYDICLIITDGMIDDMNDTIDKIYELGKYPVSIIIIGVGWNKFERMNILDADEEPLKSNSAKNNKDEGKCRDIV